MTQPHVAVLTGVGKTTVINWEKGLSSPTAVQLAALAEVGLDVLYVVTGNYSGGAKPAPTLSAEEETMLDYFRSASKDVRRAAMGALVGVPATLGMGMSNSGTGAVQVGSAGGKVVIKKGG